MTTYHRTSIHSWVTCTPLSLHRQGHSRIWRHTRDPNMDRETELVDRAAQYGAMATKHATVTFTERLAFDTAPVRYLNNFVKACMFDAACRYSIRANPAGVRVADVACGRGQDAAKWMYGARNAGGIVTTYFGLDLSSGDIDRTWVLARKYLEPTGCTITTQVADMGTDAWHLEAGTVDVVSCQLALHYLFSAEAQVVHFFREAARVLSPHGILVLSFTDGRSVVRRAREAGPGIPHRSRFYTLDVPPECTQARLPTPYGHRYVFHMQDSVEDIPEYLCHEGVLGLHAKTAGFVTGPSMYFDELVHVFRSRTRYARIGKEMRGDGLTETPPDCWDAVLDTANLYRFAVFGKNKAAVRGFAAALEEPGRCHGS